MGTSPARRINRLNVHWSKADLYIITVWSWKISSPSWPTPAKYDASCASSGAPKRNSRPGKGMGSTTGMGICHSYTPDGRCVSLLKILLTNFCLYDCVYCVNRRSSDVPRARFSDARSRVAHFVVLSAQLHRRAVPQLRHHPVGRLHHGAARRGGAVAARGPRVSRLHSFEDHSGGERRADPGGGPRMRTA